MLHQTTKKPYSSKNIKKLLENSRLNHKIRSDNKQINLKSSLFTRMQSVIQTKHFLDYVGEQKQSQHIMNSTLYVLTVHSMSIQMTLFVNKVSYMSIKCPSTVYSALCLGASSGSV